MAQTRLIVILRQQAAEMRLNAQDIEEVPGHHSYPDHLTAVFADQAGSLNQLAGEAGKNVVPVAQRKINGMGERVEAVTTLLTGAPPFNPELDEFPRVLHRQQAQHDLIEEREDRRIRADPERE